MSSSNSSFTAAINDVKQNTKLSIQISSICLFVFGIIGHTLNMYVYTRPKSRQNPCARYFVASTLSGYFILFFTIPLRMLQITYNIDVFSYSLFLCRFLSYISLFSRVLPSWFITLASIDRFLSSSSSVKRRSWSNIRVANCTIIITILCVALAYVHVPFVYTLALPQQTCSFVSNFYQSFYAIWNLILWSWLPGIGMFTFGLLIIRHIQQRRKRILPENLYQRTQTKQDRQLLQMLLVQSFLLVSTTTALSIGILYVSISNGLRVKNDLEKAKDSFLQSILNYLAISGPCMSFYIFTLSSKLFRRELYNIFSRRQIHPIIYNNNTVIIQPIGQN